MVAEAVVKFEPIKHLAKIHLKTNVFYCVSENSPSQALLFTFVWVMPDKTTLHSCYRVLLLPQKNKLYIYYLFFISIYRLSRNKWSWGWVTNRVQRLESVYFGLLMEFADHNKTISCCFKLRRKQRRSKIYLSLTLVCAGRTQCVWLNIHFSL